MLSDGEIHTRVMARNNNLKLLRECVRYAVVDFSPPKMHEQMPRPFTRYNSVLVYTKMIHCHHVYFWKVAIINAKVRFVDTLPRATCCWVLFPTVPLLQQTPNGNRFSNFWFRMEQRKIWFFCKRIFSGKNTGPKLSSGNLLDRKLRLIGALFEVYSLFISIVYSKYMWNLLK